MNTSCASHRREANERRIKVNIKRARQRARNVKEWQRRICVAAKAGDYKVAAGILDHLERGYD